MIELTNVTKSYGTGSSVQALNNITLHIGPAERVAVMGPSGSGKSTLLHIIAGVDRPTGGECRVQDVDVTRLNESQLAD